MRKKQDESVKKLEYKKQRNSQEEEYWQCYSWCN